MALQGLFNGIKGWPSSHTVEKALRSEHPLDSLAISQGINVAHQHLPQPCCAQATPRQAPRHPAHEPTALAVRLHSLLSVSSHHSPPRPSSSRTLQSAMIELVLHFVVVAARALITDSCTTSSGRTPKWFELNDAQIV